MDNYNDDAQKEIRKITSQLQFQTDLAKEYHAEMWKFRSRSRILAAVIALLGIIILVLYPANNYSIALVLNGHVETHRLGVDSVITYQGELFGRDNISRQILSQSGDDLGEFVNMRRNSLGFWSSGGVGHITLPSGGILTTNFYWIWGNYFDDRQVQGRHSLSSAYYHNINATALIELDHDLLPPYVTATIWQRGNSYLLQLHNVNRGSLEELEEIISLILDLLNDFTD